MTYIGILWNSNKTILGLWLAELPEATELRWLAGLWPRIGGCLHGFHSFGHGGIEIIKNDLAKRLIKDGRHTKQQQTHMH